MVGDGEGEKRRARTDDRSCPRCVPEHPGRVQLRIQIRVRRLSCQSAACSQTKAPITSLTVRPSATIDRASRSSLSKSLSESSR